MILWSSREESVDSSSTSEDYREFKFIASEMRSESVSGLKGDGIGKILGYFGIKKSFGKSREIFWSLMDTSNLDEYNPFPRLPTSATSGILLERECVGCLDNSTLSYSEYAQSTRFMETEYRWHFYRVISYQKLKKTSVNVSAHVNRANTIQYIIHLT